MSIVIDTHPDAKFSDLANPETSPTFELQEALTSLDKGSFFVVEATGDITPRGLSRRITVAIKRYTSTPSGKSAKFNRKRIGPATWAVQRAA